MPLHAAAREILDQRLAGHVWQLSGAMWREAVSVLTDLYLDAWRSGYTVDTEDLQHWARDQSWPEEQVSEFGYTAETIHHALRHSRLITR